MLPTPAPLIGDKPDRSHPLMDGLVGWWSMREGGGGKLYDLSGYGNHGTLTNMDAATDWVIGPHGKALDFDGSNDYMAPSVNPIIGLPQVSLSLWYWLPAAATPALNRIVSTGNFDHFELGVNYSGGPVGGVPNGRLGWFIRNTGGVWRDVGPAVRGRWSHVVIAAGANLNAYVDGVATYSAATAFVNGANSVIRFMSRFAGGSAINGRLADVRCYNRVVTNAEARELYSDPWAPFARRKVYGFAPAAGGGTTIDATIASLHIAALAATVTPATSIAATTAAVDISPLPASISVGTSVAASVAALSVAPLSASVSAGVLVEASATAVEATPLAATVSAGTAVTASTASMQANGLAASVAAGVSIAATAAQVTIAGNAASVTSGVSVSATVAALHCTALPATVSVGTSISAAVAAVEMAGNAASVSAVVSVQSTAGVIRIASHPVSITFGGRIRRPHLLTGGRMSQDWGLRSGGAL